MDNFSAMGTETRVSCARAVDIESHQGDLVGEVETMTKLIRHEGLTG